MLTDVNQPATSSAGLGSEWQDDFSPRRSLWAPLWVQEGQHGARNRAQLSNQFPAAALAALILRRLLTVLFLICKRRKSKPMFIGGFGGSSAFHTDLAAGTADPQ